VIVRSSILLPDGEIEQPIIFHINGTESDEIMKTLTRRRFECIASFKHQILQSHMRECQRFEMKFDQKFFDIQWQEIELEILYKIVKRYEELT